MLANTLTITFFKKAEATLLSCIKCKQTIFQLQ